MCYEGIHTSKYAHICHPARTRTRSRGDQPIRTLGFGQYVIQDHRLARIVKQSPVCPSQVPTPSHRLTGLHPRSLRSYKHFYYLKTKQLQLRLILVFPTPWYITCLQSCPGILPMYISVLACSTCSLLSCLISCLIIALSCCTLLSFQLSTTPAYSWSTAYMVMGVWIGSGGVSGRGTWKPWGGWAASGISMMLR